MFYVGQRVVCAEDRLDHRYRDKNGRMRNISYFDLNYARPQRGGVYTIAEIDHPGSIMLAEIPRDVSPIGEARLLKALAGDGYDPRDDPDPKDLPPQWWPSDLFRPLENSQADTHWLLLLANIRDIACDCGLARRHDGKIYTVKGSAEEEIYPIALKQFLHFEWGDGTFFDFWRARDIVDAINVVLCEAEYNMYTLPDDWDWPPPGDGGGDKGRVVQLRRPPQAPAP
jgi:hypothetical protein